MDENMDISPANFLQQFTDTSAMRSHQFAPSSTDLMFNHNRTMLGQGNTHLLSSQSTFTGNNGPSNAGARLTAPAMAVSYTNNATTHLQQGGQGMVGSQNASVNAVGIGQNLSSGTLSNSSRPSNAQPSSATMVLATPSNGTASNNTAQTQQQQQLGGWPFDMQQSTPVVSPTFNSFNFTGVNPQHFGNAQDISQEQRAISVEDNQIKMLAARQAQAIREVQAMRDLAEIRALLLVHNASQKFEEKEQRLSEKFERWMATVLESFQGVLIKLEHNEGYMKEMREGFMRLNGNIDKQFQTYIVETMKGRMRENEGHRGDHSAALESAQSQMI